MLEKLSFSGELARFGRLIEPLEVHDREHGGDLVRTLRAYFASNANITEAAGRLFMHRNSVAYRLERIGELTGLNYRDHRARLALQLGLLYTSERNTERSNDGEDERA